MSATLAAALVAAQTEMPAVPKGAKANYGTYATLDAIIDKTRPVLNKHGLAIAQFPSETSTGMPGLRTVLLHAESGETIEATVPLLLNGKHDMQALGGAITYARRYGWAAVLGIANDEDDDGNSVSAPNPAGAQQAQPPTVAQRPATNGVISEAQRKRLYAISQSKSVPDDVVKNLIREIAGVDKSDEIPRARYDQVVTAVEAWAAPPAVGVTAGAVDSDGDIPFDRTIDGLGG